MTYSADEILVGSRWIGVSGDIVTVEGLNSYGSLDPWITVVYSWQEKGQTVTHEKDVFSFQVRYSLIVDSPTLSDVV
ncbi:hypothetical protein b3_0210 [Synechococcus phage B3]|nr:hypothetical protein b3_0210 [Synechococcus phage B3]QGT54823.1 hypothetical protein b23_0208 [Synechococcus phage B23]